MTQRSMTWSHIGGSDVYDLTTYMAQRSRTWSHRLVVKTVVEPCSSNSVRKMGTLRKSHEEKEISLSGESNQW